MIFKINRTVTFNGITYEADSLVDIPDAISALDEFLAALVLGDLELFPVPQTTPIGEVGNTLGDGQLD